MKIFTDHDEYYNKTKLIIKIANNYYSIKFPISTYFQHYYDGWSFQIIFHDHWIGRDDSYKIPF